MKLTYLNALTVSSDTLARNRGFRPQHFSTDLISILIKRRPHQGPRLVTLEVAEKSDHTGVAHAGPKWT